MNHYQNGIELKQIGVFPGSFNPIHIGHLILANYIIEFTYIDEVWFVVTPHNPSKVATDLADKNHRLQMCRIALANMEKLKVSEVEFSMPKPSFTIKTLDKLQKDYTDFHFSLIIGADNWNKLHLWKEHKRIKRDFKILIYPRLNEEVKVDDEFKDSVQLCNAPILDISSTFIRKSIKEKKNVRAFLPKGVFEYILKHNIYMKDY